ncbi:MAG: SAM-dependent methyltransferase [Acidimicrobiales bacterium]
MAATAAAGTPCAIRIGERIRRFGPIGFDAFLDMALYDPEAGFYSTGAGAPGRGGADFLTSPELGPLFGAVLARALDTWWEEQGFPDPWLVVDAGAGTGALAAGILGASPKCARALRYVLVERSRALRDRQAERLPLEPPGLSGLRAAAGGGPLVTSIPDLPGAGSAPVGVILANELLDNLPFRLLERAQGAGTQEGWLEIRAGLGSGDRLVEVPVPAPPELAALATRLAPEAGPRARVPVQTEAASWVRRALTGVERGRVVIVDYTDTTPRLAARPWTEWLRTYRSHGRGGGPLEAPGLQDVTCEVAIDQLTETVGPPASDRPQAEFLRAHGIEELTHLARERWEAGAAVGDLEALAARSRLGEAAALCDPTGMGAFRVLEWVV